MDKEHTKHKRAAQEGPAATYEHVEAPDGEPPQTDEEGPQSSPVAQEEGERAAPEGASDLTAQLAAARAEAEEYKIQWQRSAADFINFKRRNEQERAEMARLFNVSLVQQLLPVLDNFERALASVPEELKGQPWVEGVSLTEKQLRSALEKEGLAPIEAVGHKFDPNLHEAVAHDVSEEHEEDSVIEEFQKGYKLHDRVIRPSMVKVSRRS